MIDIVDVGSDIVIQNSDTPRAANILNTQLGSLTYNQDLGADIKYFLNESISFQNESFKAYLVEVLANWGINVDGMVEIQNALSSDLTITIAKNEQSSSLIAR